MTSEANNEGTSAADLLDEEIEALTEALADDEWRVCVDYATAESLSSMGLVDILEDGDIVEIELTRKGHQMAVEIAGVWN